MPKPRTLAQNRAIHSLLGKTKIDAELKGQMVARITNYRTTHTSEMYFHEANTLIVELGGTAQSSSLRTQQHHRQQAGVVQIITPEQNELLTDLARKRWGVEYEVPLKRLALRVIKKLRPSTTIEANKVIEAIKAMNARDVQPKEAA